VNNGHAYLSAPYGIYKTADGYLALAMGDITRLAALLQCDLLKNFTNTAEWFVKRDEIKTILADHLTARTTDEWLSVLEPADIWCAKVMDYAKLVKENGYQLLNMEIKVKTSNGLSITTTRCPIRFDGEIFASEIGAPLLGEHNDEIDEQFGLISKLANVQISK
jgi:crotonobetainyl-CoA:carnitine CoA-transferase CaiB-like acyl-CoA transferase